MFNPRPVRLFGLAWCALLLGLGGQARAQVPTIAVFGGGRSIADGDSTPSLLDHTDFGEARAGEEVVDRMFTIENTGGGTLLIFGLQRVGGSPENFSIIAPPSQQLPGGSATNFTVRFFPGLIGGVRNTNLVISTNDDATPQFAFLIQGKSVLPAPEINIQGNGVDIMDGDEVPTLADHTDFGSVDIAAGPITRNFTLQNIGEAPLRITNFELTGGNSSDFLFTSFPAVQLPQGTQFEFQISFDPSSTGLHNVNVRIHNTDEDESIYDFVIQGEGTTVASEVSLTGNGVPIAAGDDSPSAHDHTKFASARPGASSRRTFTITNTGNSNLTIGAITPIGGQAAEFTIPVIPAAPLFPDGSVTFDVLFRPAARGPRTTTLRISSNDPATPAYDVALFGAGGAFELLRVDRQGPDAIVVFHSNPDTQVSNYFYTIQYSLDLRDWDPVGSLVSPGATVEQHRHAGGFLAETGYWRVREVAVP